MSSSTSRRRPDVQGGAGPYDDQIQRDLTLLLRLSEEGFTPNTKVEPPGQRYRGLPFDTFATSNPVREKRDCFEFMVRQIPAWWDVHPVFLAGLEFPSLYDRAILTSVWMNEVFEEFTPELRFGFAKTALDTWHNLGQRKTVIEPPDIEADADWIATYCDTHRPVRYMSIEMAEVALLSGVLQLENFVRLLRSPEGKARMKASRQPDPEQYTRGWEEILRDVLADMLVAIYMMGASEKRADAALKKERLLIQLADIGGWRAHLDGSIKTQPAPLMPVAPDSVPPEFHEAFSIGVRLAAKGEPMSAVARYTAFGNARKAAELGWQMTMALNPELNVKH